MYQHRQPSHSSYEPANPYAGVQRVHPPGPVQGSNGGPDDNNAVASSSTGQIHGHGLGQADHHTQPQHHPQPTRLHPPPPPYDPSRPAGAWYHPHFAPVQHDWTQYHQYGGMPFHYPPNQFGFTSYPPHPRTALPASMTNTPLSTPSSANPSLPSTSGIAGSSRTPLKPLTESAINALQVSHGTFDPNVVKREFEEEGEDELSPVTLPKPVGDDEVEDSLSDMDLDPNDGDAPYLPTKKAAKKAASAVKARSKAKKGKRQAKGKGRAPTKRSVPASPLTTTSPATTTGAGPSHTPFFGHTGQVHSIHPSLLSDNHDLFQDLKNAMFPLMPPPTGSFLDVNDLLIRHPPALSPSNSHEAINQYSKSQEPHSAGEGQSKWEMYTCRACRKTYDGKNARSVARRHLQDKHGIPLGRQARRTRWDQDLDRPKNPLEAQERSKKCKRDWAKVTRQQRALEKLHADFLLQFGPDGLQTSWKHPLVAPLFRDGSMPKPKIDPGVAFRTSQQVVIPPSLRESALLLQQIEAAVEKDESMPFVSFEDLLYLDEGLESDPTQRPSPVKLSTTTSNGSILTLPTPPPRHSFQPYTSTPSSAARLGVDAQQHGPDLEALLAQPPFTNPSGTLENGLDPTEQYYGFLAVETQLEVNGQSTAAANEDTDADEAESPPPLWVEPSWQEWREFPSTSSASLQVSMQLDSTVGASGTATPPQPIDEAAESLLDLHSSPAKAASGSTTKETHNTLETASVAESASAVAALIQPDWMDGIADMIADYSSRPTLKHTKSLSTSVRHPFLNRPGHLARSLSTATLLDDPFILDSNSTPARQLQQQQEEQHSSASPQLKSKSKSQAASRVPRFSPSPMIERKRRPLESISSNLNVNGNGTGTGTSTSHLDSKYETPLRPSRANGGPPSSVGMEKWLQFSSPVDPAASLGLVPMHAVPTTPGLSMIIGQDTPAGPGASVAGKKRRAVGVGVGAPIR